MNSEIMAEQLHSVTGTTAPVRNPDLTFDAAHGSTDWNPTSVILKTGTRYLLPLLILFALFLLVRGHNEPGGGFVAGLVTAAALALYAMTVGVDEASRLLRVEPIHLIAAGLATALSSGLLALMNAQPYMTGIWHGASIPLLGKFGTPFLFDVGVYLVVTGIVVKILFTLLHLDSVDTEAVE